MKYMCLFELSLNQSGTVAEMRDLYWEPNVADQWVWRHDPGGGYTVRGTPSTKDNLLRRHIITQDSQFCATGCGGLGTKHHLFFSCPMFTPLWSLIGTWVVGNAAKTVINPSHEMAPKPFNFPAKRTTAIFLLTASTAAAAATANSDNLSPLTTDKIRAQIHGIVRTTRAVSTVASTVIDYEFSLRGLRKHSDQYHQAISQVHLRSAERFLKLCEDNKGFYVKAGQFIASQKVLPREYSSTLSSLQDQVSPLPFKVIEKVLKDNLGPDFSEKFLSIDERPIGAASIAQVHHAVLKSGQEVAIKAHFT
ncbi:hypothetical protein TSUD_213370 [Trifolium subterraneum]|uniref:ABC1 atypical kinase-like domain-containing protein n=1 Tax=Trifolium subterraneum TaxID=3900 RepID=A0A2Z6NJX6_TRISU|nr:hypothetical protein TSUD_213370 [Trifolium subterraneum]